MVELPRTEEGQVALPPSPAEMGREQTVREQLAEAAECLPCPDRVPMANSLVAVEYWKLYTLRLALDRHRAEPEEHCQECKRKDAQIASLMEGHCLDHDCEDCPRCGGDPDGVCHRAEPEWDTHTAPCERCRGTGARHVAGEPTQEPCGECSGESIVLKPKARHRDEPEELLREAGQARRKLGEKVRDGK